jgi:hypothetical protein
VQATLTCSGFIWIDALRCKAKKKMLAMGDMVDNRNDAVDVKSAGHYALWRCIYAVRVQETLQASVSSMGNIGVILMLEDCG